MFKIAGTGVSLPDNVMSNFDLEQMHNLRPGQIEHAPGVQHRHHCTDETQISMAVEAAHRALEDASVRAEEIDLIVFAAAVPYQPIPSSSAILMYELGIADGSIETFDLNTTCLSFLSAMDKVGKMMRGGAYRRVLIVSSEVASRALPWQTDPETAALFGDGAAAAILTPDNEAHCASLFRTYSSGWEFCQIQSGGTRHDYHNDPDTFAQNARFNMKGRDLYRMTLKTFPPFVEEILKAVGWDVEEIDTIIPHQASPHALTHMKRACGFSDAQIIETIQRTGNMIAASIPYTLHQARIAGRADPGSKILLLGTSAGLSLGGLALEVT